MAKKKVKIPPIPTRGTHFERGILMFKVLEGCAYCQDAPGFTGGDWVPARLRSKNGNPVVLRLDGGELVVEEYVYGGECRGFKRREIIRINVLD